KKNWLTNRAIKASPAIRPIRRYFRIYFFYIMFDHIILTMPTMKDIRTAQWRYLAGLVVYGLGLLIYTHNPFYRSFILPETLTILKTLFLVYFFLGWPFHIFNAKAKDHKPSRLILSLPRLAGKLSQEEKNTLLFFLVKFFYIPIMLNFFVTNSRAVFDIISRRIAFGRFSFDLHTDYINLFPLIFTLDTLFFAFGYLVEHPKLGNTIKSVEPTLFGWVVALATYPPFNNLTANYLGWYSNDYFFMSNPVVDIVLKVMAVGLLGVYLWATFSLGFKCSNLTNRGIVANGAYKHIRHPAYASKILFWWLTALPRFSPAAVLSLLGWTTLYYLRAVTEERHLSKDPDFRRYTRQTRFRFIPGLV
ncbi:MAG: methyltransferase, partial [Microgenomates group bacterium]